MKFSMPLNKPSDAEMQTLYMNGRTEYLERYGSYIAQRNNWRLAALGAIAVALCSLGGLVAVSLQSKVVPYAVELNGHQEVVRVHRADLLSAPNANQIRASLRSWVIGARSVYRDPKAMQTMIVQTYAMTMPKAAAFADLANHHRANDPYKRAASEAVDVEVKAIVPISDTTWQVEWTETTKQGEGKGNVSTDWQGSFTIAVSPPTDTKQIMLNPLGLYVTQFSWTPRLKS